MTPSLSRGSDYRPWDREEKLGAPPWSGAALKEWEEAHGHDARLKCYPEFGCQLLHDEEDYEQLRAVAQAVFDAAGQGGDALGVALVNLGLVLAGEDPPKTDAEYDERDGHA